MVRSRLALVGLFAALALVGTAAQAQVKDTVVEKASTARSRGADTNVKALRGANSATADVPAPANKAPGRAKGAAAAYTLTLDNSTPWFIDIYIDGYYRGTMGPWADSWAYTATGSPRVYARADFDDGSYKYWGPRIVTSGYFRMIR